MKTPNVSFGEARRRWVRIKFIERLRLIEWLISGGPRKKPSEVAYFSSSSSFFLSSKYIIPASVSPLDFSIASGHFATGLLCISLCCLPNFVSLASLSRPTLSPLNIKSPSVFTLPLLSSPLSVSLSLSVCLCSSLSRRCRSLSPSVTQIIQYWRCQLGMSRSPPTLASTPLAKRAMHWCTLSTRAGNKVTSRRNTPSHRRQRSVAKTQAQRFSRRCVSKHVFSTSFHKRSSHFSQLSLSLSLSLADYFPPTRPPSSLFPFVIPPFHSWEAITVFPWTQTN